MVTRKLELIPGDTGQETGYTVGRSLTPSQTDNHSWSHWYHAFPDEQDASSIGTHVPPWYQRYRHIDLSEHGQLVTLLFTLEDTASMFSKKNFKFQLVYKKNSFFTLSQSIIVGLI